MNIALRLRASLLSMGLLVAVAAGGLGYQTACGSSREPTALFLGVSSDLVVADDLDAVGLFVSVKGEIKHARVDGVRPGGILALPGTISILDPEDPATPVHIRVVGYRAQQVVSVRDAISTVPPNRISVLRLPIQWLSGGDKVGGKARAVSEVTPASGRVRPQADPIAGGDHFPEFAKYFENLKLPCPPNQTMVNGECKGLDVTDVLVPTQGGDHVAQVFGGASGIDDRGVPFGGACFPALTCYEGAEKITLADLGPDCTVAKTGAPVDRVNFGIRRKSCTDDRCTIALDYTPEPNKVSAPGWYEKDGRYQLPKGICDPAGRRESVVEVLVTTKCRNKVAAMPTCGTWSAIDTAAAAPEPIPPYFANSPALDAGADGPDAVAPGPWAIRTLREVGNDVPGAVALALGADTIWVVGRSGRAAGYPLSNPASPVTMFGTVPDGGVPQFPFVAAQGQLVVATLPLHDGAFEFVRHAQSPSLPISGRSTGAFITAEKEPVFVNDPPSAITSMKVYPPDGGDGTIHNFMTAWPHHSASLDEEARPRRLLLAVRSGVDWVTVPAHTEVGTLFPTPTGLASHPARFAAYSSLSALGTRGFVFWSAYDDTVVPSRMAVFRAARTDGGSSGEEWVTELAVTPRVAQDVSPLVGDDDAIFFSNGLTVYGKRVGSDKTAAPVVLHTVESPESILGLAYDKVNKVLYAVTERGTLFGGVVTLP